MNQKQAKRLRRAALGLAATLTEQGKDIKQDGYMVKVHRKLKSGTQSADVLEAPEPQMEETLQLVVRPDSLKGIYKSLKKAARAGA